MKKSAAYAAAILAAAFMSFGSIAQADTAPTQAATMPPPPGAPPQAFPMRPRPFHPPLTAYLGLLNLTPTQRDQIKAINQDSGAKRQAIMSQIQQLQQAARQLQEATMKSVMDVLTPDQQAKLKDLQDQATANMPTPGQAPMSPPGQAPTQPQGGAPGR